MKKEIFSALVVLALLVIGAFLFTTRSNSNGGRYSGTATALSQTSKTSPDFAEAQKQLAQKNYDAARQSYEKSLNAAQDQTQKNLSNYYIAFTDEQSGDYAHAIQLYKQIAATPSGLGRAEAVQEIGQMYYSYPSARTAIVAETFKDAPYSSFKEGGDIALAYRKLFEYAASFYPLGISEGRIAYWYASDVATHLKATTTPQAVSEIAIVQQSIAKADANIQWNVQFNSVEKAFNPSIYVLEARSLAQLASVGIGSSADVESVFKKAVDGADASGAYGFERYRYAEYLANTFGTKRKADVADLLSVFVGGGGKLKITQGMQNLFRSARTEQVFSSAKATLIKLAQIDSAFKTYLISLGWHEADFK